MREKMQWNLFLVILFAQPSLMVCQLYDYHYINEEKTWTEAQQYCREKHTDLATVSNMADMKRLLSNSAGNMKEAWIGLYDQTDGIRTWYWSLPGVEFNETNWKEGEPDDYETENCAGRKTETSKWSDISCDHQTYFLCYNENKTSEKFYLIKEEKTWLEAQSYCREKHTDLISGMDQLKEFQLKDVLSVDSWVFIGLFRDTWRWSDGRSFSFRHWNLQFDDEKYNSGQCAMTVFDDGGRWKNEDCAAKKPFICYDDNLILVKEKMNWKDALSYCREHYHDLVTIKTLEQQILVQEKAKKASTPFVWLALRYNCTKKFWVWVYPERVTSRTQNSGGEVDDCNISGAMDTGGQHKWFQRNGGEEFNFICSKI
ncbi:PREDICTED: macrophage mannose receptor 1-like [Cyprinodon variegatus]|uniref:Macrophage mannose receptor 1-like n=2 Tax=Cyprinodon variegatus TaxID=28743 RepID=A0A3Q2DL27_CYPVA|nr:PREDICTED: macrophage mannose receptor 1-like [Cyprinodon variegatus]